MHPVCYPPKPGICDLLGRRPGCAERFERRMRVRSGTGASRPAQNQKSSAKGNSLVEYPCLSGARADRWDAVSVRVEGSCDLNLKCRQPSSASMRWGSTVRSTGRRRRARRGAPGYGDPSPGARYSSPGARYPFPGSPVSLPRKPGVDVRGVGATDYLYRPL